MPTPTVRGVQSASFNNTGGSTYHSVVLPFPTGSAAGDQCLIFFAHPNPHNIPAGWNVEDETPGSGTRGSVYYKVLTAADITAGSVTVTTTGDYYGWAVIIGFVGSAMGIDAAITQLNNGGAGTRTLTTTGGPTPAIGDYAIYFGFGRCNGTVSSSRGTVLSSGNSFEASYVLAGEVLAAAGQVTDVFSFAATPSADYEAVIVMGPPQQHVSVAGEYVAEGPASGNFAASVAGEYVAEGPPSGRQAISVMGLYVVEGPPGPSTARRRTTFLTG